MTPPARRRAHASDAHDADLRDARARRRSLATAGALLGVAPFTHALAPHCLPALLHALTSIWAATILALFAATVEEQLLARR